FGLFVSGLSVVALVVSLALTRTALKDNREIGEAQIRAYVDAKNFRFEDIAPNQKPKASVTFVNTGQSPARQFSMVVGFRVTSDPDGVRFRFGKPRGPNGSISAGGEALCNWEGNTVLTEENVRDLDAGRAVVVMGGIASYLDVFGHPR